MVRVRLDAMTEHLLTLHPEANGNTGGIEAARKGAGHPTSHADGSTQVSSLTGTPLRTKVYGTTFTFHLYVYLCYLMLCRYSPLEPT